jgi:hypothetical protein
MMHAAEDVTRFLHKACRGLPHRVNGRATEHEGSNQEQSVDRFYARVIEHAIAYFGSRVLYPCRPAPTTENASLKLAAVEKIAQAAAQGEDADFEASALALGQSFGCQIYDAYLAGKVPSSALRRLFLAHLDEPGMARKVCGAVLSKLRAIARPIARAAHV